MSSIFFLTIALLFAPIEWLTYKDASDRFTMKYPNVWEKQSKDDLAAFLSPMEHDSDVFREHVYVTVQDLTEKPMTMAEYTKVTTDWVKGAKGTMQLEREIEFAGNKATEIAYTLPPDAIGLGIELMFYQVWIIKQNKAYLLTYSAEPNKYHKFEPEAMDMMRSFQLKK
jgi:eukaryotic-like serine/threonine-protein kinase